ncbi:MAG: nucleotidyltransferase family protein [Gammaproteobacteria bacterium]|nr:nucleotidyltransferase family protein [Gammaproteobacteria bacterium]
MRLKRFGAVLLAAGLSSRFTRGDKLLQPYRGQPLLYWALTNLERAHLAECVVVVGCVDDEKRALVARHPFALTANPNPAAGMGSSIAAGVAALTTALDGIFICLGDMPDVEPATFEQLATSFAIADGTAIIAPVYRGRRGHPVLFAPAYREALCALTGDQGARAVVESASTLVTIEVETPGVLLDIDTVADMMELDAQ